MKSILIGLLFTVYCLSCTSLTNEKEEIKKLFNDKEYNQVIETCSDVLEKIRSKEALLYRGKSYYLLGKYGQAYDDYHELFTTGDTSTEVIEGLAYTSLYLNQYEFSYKAFQKLIQKDTTNSENYFYLTLMCIKDKRVGEALKYLDFALKIKPYNSKYLNNKGLLLEEQGRYRESIACYSKIIRNGINNDTFYYNRGIAYGHINEYDSSIIDLSNAISLNSSKGLYYYNRAFMYMYKKDKKNACLDLEKAKSLESFSIDKEIENYCER